MNEAEQAFELFRASLRKALEHDPHGDFGAEAAVAAFDECIALAKSVGATEATSTLDVEP